MPSKSRAVDNRVVVIGAGPAGLAGAHELCKNGCQTVVLEKDSNYVGGLARTVSHAGYRFDLGGHRFFTKNPAIELWWRDRLGDDLKTVARKSSIFYRGKYLSYPLSAGDVFRKLGLATTFACVLSYGRAVLFPARPERSFSDWVSNRFGARLFEIFFKDYTEKVWGLSCDEISADWASQRIKDLSLAQAVLNAAGFRSRRKVIKTLTDRFLYPRLGPGMMWDRASAEIRESGGEIRMGEEVVAIHHSDGEVRSVTTRGPGGEEQTYQGSSFLASMPLQQAIQVLTPRLEPEILSAASNLRYRDFLTVALVIRRPKLFADNWIYIQDRSVQVGRIQNFNNWSSELVGDPGTTCLGLEYFCFKDDSLWRTPDEGLVALGTGELQRLGIAAADEITQGVVVRTEKAYPVYYPGYLRDVTLLREALSRFRNLQMIGRNGLHRYNNMDHSMMTGILAAQNVLGADYDVWQVNTDAEYQEETRVRPANGEPGESGGES